jgi:hypothetical protein
VRCGRIWWNSSVLRGQRTWTRYSTTTSAGTVTTFARADCAARRGNWNRTANTAGSKQRLPVNINSLLRCAAKVFTRYRRQGRERAGPSVDKRLAIHTPEMAAEEHRRRSRQRPCPVPKASPLKRTTEPTPKTPSSIRSKCIPASSASRRAVPRRARACSVFAGGRRPLAHGSGHGVAAWMRCSDGGLRSSRKAGRIGRGHRLPPQLGHIPIKWPSTQRRQKVHS